MRLNSLKPKAGSRKKARRLGRGIGCTKGKTCGKGHKGQKARAGGYHKVGFQGGQMPLQRRLPKFGFRSKREFRVARLRLSELQDFPKNTVIDLKSLKAANCIPIHAKTVKVYLSGELTQAVTLKGVAVTPGAKAAILAAGGKVE